MAMNPDVCLIYNTTDLLPPNVPVVTGNFTSGAAMPNGMPVGVSVSVMPPPGTVFIDSQGNATFVTAPPPPAVSMTLPSVAAAAATNNCVGVGGSVAPMMAVADPQQLQQLQQQQQQTSTSSSAAAAQHPPPLSPADASYANQHHHHHLASSPTTTADQSAIAAAAAAAAYASASFAMAPGAEHTAHKLQQQILTNNNVINGHQHHGMDSHKKVVMDYESDFPTLAPNDQSNAAQQSSAWYNKSPGKTLPVKTTTVTQVFNFPAEERRYLNTSEHGFGEKNQEQDECNAIMQKTGTSIELCQNKDNSLTIVVSGKRANVEEARKLIVQSLQTQCHREIRIPKDHHRVLIGREGKKLQLLEKETDCRIMIPNRDTPSEMIKISGPREGIEKAIHQIQLISDEQSKLAQEHLTIPKVFYPFIRGPFNENVDRITQETGARINIPPSTAVSEIIVVTGEKEGVHRAVAVIKQIYEEKKNSQTVTIQVERSQHRFIIGPQRSGLADILKETGVSVEVPPEEADSNSITLRGDPAKLAAALAMVYTKASSVITAEIECPSWLHKYVIGPRGSGIRQIVGEDPNGNKSQVQVSFEEEGRIFLEGPPAEVKRVREALSKIVKDLQADYVYEILHVNPIYHRHVIGKSGSNISKIRQETGASVAIPSDDSHSDEIRIEGRKEGVSQAKDEIMELVKKMENEKTRDIVIENRFHRLIIGTKGESVRELRDKFPGVVIQFPEPGRKTDIVSLRGPKDEVDKCHKYLQNLAKELKENNYQERIQVFKEFHPHIIGKGGMNIKKIRDETDTKIELPVENSSNDIITVTGKRANVDKAKEMLRKLEGELASVVTAEISIPHKIHKSLIGGGGRLIQHIAQSECGGVQIKFPSEKMPSDKVTIRGPKENVEKAKKMLLDLAKDRELTGFTLEVKAKPELFRYMTGRGGSKMQKLRDSNPKVRIMMPKPDDTDQETIHLMGRKEDVEAAKSQLEALITELNHLVELQVDIDPKHHRYFVSRGALVLHEIQDQCGGVMISFPKQNTNSSIVIVKGGKECAESAKKRLLEIVDDLESQVTIKVPVPQRYHGQLLANRGAKIQDITQQCNVQIKFPERTTGGNGNGGRNSNATTQSSDYTATTGGTTSNSTSPISGAAAAPVAADGTIQAAAGGGAAGSSDLNTSGDSSADNQQQQQDESATVADPRDLITIIGRAEKCEEARELLMAEIPVSEIINVPFDFHRNLIGRSGAEIRKLMDRFHVFVRIPPQDEHSDEITVTGPPANVREAIEAIMSRVEEFEEEAKDRELKSFQVSAHVPAEYHSKLIGAKGAEINRIRAKYDVQITIPPKNSENPDEIIITGYEKNANDCKEEIERTVAAYKSLYSLEITLDSRVHSRIIGQKGKNVRKVMDQYGVEIRFPRSTDADPNLVVITGKSEDSVYDCIDYLRNLEEEYLQDITDRQREAPRFDMGSAVGSTGAVPGFDVEISGKTPWSSRQQQQQQQQQQNGDSSQIVPDMADMTDFPTMAGGGTNGLNNGSGGGEGGSLINNQNSTSSSGSKWGRRNY